MDRIQERMAEVNTAQLATAPENGPEPQFEIDGADQELEDMHRQLESAQEAAADLAQERDELKGRLDQLQAEANRLREREQTFRAEIKSATEETARAKDQVEDRAAAAERQAAHRIRAQVQQIEAEAKAAHDDLARTQAELDASQTTITQRESEIVDLRKANRVLETQVSGLAAALQEETEKAARLRDKVAAALLHAEQEIKNLTERLSAALRLAAAVTSERDDLERHFEASKRSAAEQADRQGG